MTCSGPIIKTVTISKNAVVFSAGGSTGTPAGQNVIILSPDSLIQIAPLLAKVRGTMRIQNKTENFECKLVYQLTDDGETWDSAVDISSGYVAQNGYTTTDWLAISNTKRGIRFGVVCAQVAGTNVEMARVSIILDLFMQS